MKPRNLAAASALVVLIASMSGGCLLFAGTFGALALAERSPVPASAATTAGPPETPSSTPALTPTLPSSTPRPSAAPLPTPTSATCPAETLAQMSAAQRIGQLFMVGMPTDQVTAGLRTAITVYHLGNVWFAARTNQGIAAVRRVTDGIQALASADATRGVRFFVAANQEGGLIQGLGGPGFSLIPSALIQGSLAPAALQRVAAGWADELRAAGVNLDFAPVADVVPPGDDAVNAPIGALEREYGPDPATVGSHLVAFIRAFQQAGVATTVKHFPGLGRVTGNTDFVGGVVDTVTTSTDPYLGSFAVGVQAGVPFVMVSLATYRRIDAAHLAAFSSRIIDGLLRRQLGFHGVVMSDSLTATAVGAISPAARAIAFLSAGGDMLVLNSVSQAEQMASAIRMQSAADPSFRTLVDAAALRILQAKEAYGLLRCSG